MIPKVIHYCWFGKKEKPQSVEKCISTWKEKCPDYVIKEWNEENFDINCYRYAKEAYEVGKFAFVSDVARLKALTTEGGIYLDTDVRILKSFEPFMNHKSFIGMESPFWVSTAVIGAEAGTQWLKDFLLRYETSHFIRRSGMLRMEPNTYTLSLFLHSRFPSYEKELKIYPMDFFCAKVFATKEYRITDNTICVHDFASTWLSVINRRQQMQYAFKRLFLK